MCFGGGSSAPYSAYSSGDSRRWQNLFEEANALEDAIAAGTAGEGAEQQLAALQSQLERTGDSASRDPAFSIEKREIERQRDVTLGKQGIDTAFGRFDDDYFDEFRTARQDFYTPQLSRQFEEARGSLVAALHGRGTLESTVGARKLSNLSRLNDETSLNIANESQDESNRLRQTVQNSKTNLFNLNAISADPQAINAQAQGQATAIVAPTAFSPLGQVFAASLQPFVNFNNAQQSRPGVPFAQGNNVATGFGSGRVVN